MIDIVKIVRFQVLSVASLEMTVFCRTASCCLVHRRPYDGDSKYLRNGGLFLQDYAAHCPRRQ